MTSSDFISAAECAADAATALSDEGYKKKGYSFYLNAIHRAVEALSIDTFYNQVTKDIMNWNSCGDLKIDLPCNLFNIREMYVFNSNCPTQANNNGQCNCGCNQSSPIQYPNCWHGFAVVHFKRLYNKFGSSGKTTSRIGAYTNGIWDAAIQKRVWVNPSLVYCGIQNNQLCFNDSAKCFQNLRIVANGFASENDALPVIPRMARQAIIDKTVERVLYALKVKDRTYRIDWQDAVNQLDNGTGKANNPGTWVLATRRLRTIDTFIKQEMLDYFSGIDNK